MKRNKHKILLRLLLAGAAGLLLIFGLPRIITQISTNPLLYTTANVPARKAGIVFGAGLNRSGTPSAVLRDRIETAAQLYAEGKIQKILMSGDNRFVDYNEPGAMRDYAKQLGVPEKDIVLDYAGRRTYDTCYRARHIFEIDEAILISQSFHLPRALFTCSNLGIKSIGVPSDVRHYLRRSYAYWNIREIPATTVAFWQVWVTRPLPVLGKPEPIFTNQIPLSEEIWIGLPLYQLSMSLSKARTW
jgi:SanA protein